MSVPGWFSCSDCTKSLCQHRGLVKTLWRENHSFHHLSRGPVETGLGMAGVPPSVQPSSSLTCCLPQSASSSFWGCSVAVGTGQKGWTAKDPASLPTLGATRVAGRSLFLVPFRQGAPLCTQLSSGEGQQHREFTVQSRGLWPSVSSEQSPERRECPWQGCVS